MSLIDLFTTSLEDITEILNEVLYSTPLLWVQFFSAVISVILIVLWFRLVAKTEVFKSKKTTLQKAFKGEVRSFDDIFHQWGGVENKLQSNYASDWKLAVIAADSMLDKLIESLGYNGDTMGERMKRIKPGQFPYLDDAWRVHKVRNFLAHDASYELSHQSATRTIEIYRKIFREFGME